jgi:hypothetical protein
MKKWHHKRGVVSHGGDILVLFYYLIASEIWPDKRVVLLEEDYCICLLSFYSIMSELPQYEKENKESEEEEVSR